MIRIKSDLKPYAVEVPTAISEIDETYFKWLLQDIQLAKNYAIIAVCYKDRLFSILSDFKNNNNGMRQVVPIIAKINCDVDDNPTAIVENIAVIDGSALERGTHLILPNNSISFASLCNYCLNDSNLAKAIMSGAFFNDGKATGAHEAKMSAPDVYFVEFKIVPICDIKASYDKNANIACSKSMYEKVQSN